MGPRRRGLYSAGTLSARRLLVLAVLCTLPAGCGLTVTSSSTPSATLYVSAPTDTYDESVAGAKLALAEHGGRAGGYIVKFVGQSLPVQADLRLAAATAAARRAVQDPLAGAFINDDPDSVRSIVPLLNEAGVPVLDVGGSAGAVCDGNLYPNGRRTAVAVAAQGGAARAAFDRRFRQTFGHPASERALRSYVAASAVLRGLQTGPAELDRAALGRQLVTALDGCRR
jgi:hypothetical protein